MISYYINGKPYGTYTLLNTANSTNPISYIGSANLSETSRGQYSRIIAYDYILSQT